MEEKIEFNGEFEGDEGVVGRWEVVAAVEKKEDFKPGGAGAEKEWFTDEVYFLPEGRRYWTISWTKGYLKLSSGDGNMLCRYEREVIGGESYMFVRFFDEIVVLKQTDTKSYTAKEIGRYDDVDLPFENDESILGKWISVDFVDEIGDFSPTCQVWVGEKFFKSIKFLPDGKLRCVWGANAFDARWTKGTTLLKTGDGTTAPAYEVRTLGGAEYLFIEWKSGDYVWGKRQPCWYVFKREG